MPRLTDEERSVVNESRRLGDLAFRSYSGPQYWSMNCRVCNMAINGESTNEAFEATRAHESNHPGINDFDAFSRRNLGLDVARDALHDHECKVESCTCQCGCTSGPFCILIFGPLCSVCQVRSNRGDSDHCVAV